MSRFLFAALLLFVSNICMAHTCQPDMTLGKKFNESKRVFLIYVEETKLEEKLQREMSEKDGSADQESVKLVSAGYRIVEDYKGEKKL